MTAGAPTDFPVGGTITALAAGPDVVWIVDAVARAARAVDASTGVVSTTVPTGGVPTDVALGEDGFVYVTIAAP